MKTKTILISILILCSITGFAQDKLANLWQKGNDYYSKKIYDSAAYYFEQIATLKPTKADVYYNLGNTYYRLNKIGPAILNYERALKINPNYKDAKDNLMLTQNRISNHIVPMGEIFFIKWWNSITHPVKATVWAIFGLVIFMMIIGLLLLNQFYRNIASKIPKQTLYILGFLWFLFMVFAVIAANNGIKKMGGVIMQNNTPFMNNDMKGKPITQLPEGTTVTIISEKDAWLEVRLPDGRIGLVQQSFVEKI